MRALREGAAWGAEASGARQGRPSAQPRPRPALPLPGQTTSGQLLNLLGSQFHYPQKGGRSTPYRKVTVGTEIT